MRQSESNRTGVTGKYKGYSDRQLIEAVALSSKAAMTELVIRYYHAILLFVTQQLGHIRQSEEIAQETFIKVWLKAGQINLTATDTDLYLKAWIYKIAYNLCIDYLRQDKYLFTSIAEDSAVERLTPEDEVYKHEKDRLFNTALFKIPERQRSAILLCNYQGLSNIEAARVMDISVEAVESLLSRGRKKLATLLLCD